MEVDVDMVVVGKGVDIGVDLDVEVDGIAQDVDLVDVVAVVVIGVDIVDLLVDMGVVDSVGVMIVEDVLGGNTVDDGVGTELHNLSIVKFSMLNNSLNCCTRNTWRKSGSVAINSSSLSSISSPMPTANISIPDKCISFASPFTSSGCTVDLPSVIIIPISITSGRSPAVLKTCVRSSCRAAAVFVSPCGGPRFRITFCNTDFDVAFKLPKMVVASVLNKTRPTRVLVGLILKASVTDIVKSFTKSQLAASANTMLSDESMIIPRSTGAGHSVI